MSNQRSKKNSGFTLIELIVVIAIIGILVAIAVPRFSNAFVRAKITADQATVRALNTSTQMLRLSAPASDPFENEEKSSDELMGALVDDGYLGETVTPQTEEATFEWLFDEEKWRLMFEDSFYTITLDNFGPSSNGRPAEINNIGWLKGSYIGESKDIVIPASMLVDGEAKSISAIQQHVFEGAGLVAVDFDDDSQITRFHRDSFRDNQLTQIDFPDTLTRIDGNAFAGNNITEVSIGDGVTTFEENIFGSNTHDFTLAYQRGGAGTYVLENENWVKQAD